ncbi:MULTISPECIES: HNH endonuclease signature motif containing protein [Streptomyces]|nr:MULTISPECIES: HNH endonuclease signature motif containing protein [Streptomyces]MDT0423531.1 HNH endonuclease signature motif containing protein [Streptomyces sp. DSM 41859]WAU09946.1 HNH endonuclease [Streptomyces nigrescens]
MHWSDRFLASTEAGPGGCWQWTGYLMPNGYARISVDGERQYAHRVAYEAFVAPIPAGLVIDHLCRNRGCVNPDHLDAVTQRVNVLRGESHAAARARQVACIRGHRFDHANTYRATNGTRKCRRCRANARSRARSRQGVTCAAA